MGVDKLGVDKVGVDEMGSRRSGTTPIHGGERIAGSIFPQMS